MISKSILLKEGKEMLELIYDRIESLENLNLRNLDPNSTMILVIDLNKGFAKGGALYSHRIEKLINPISDFIKAALKIGITIKAFTDYHTEDSVELKAYPKHCLEGSCEWEIVDELNIEEIEVIRKNSTNGFLEEKFTFDKEKIKNIIVVGDCTDICVYQIAISLRADLNRENREGEVYVLKNLVDTFDSTNHKANFMNYVFLNSLMDNGVKVFKEVDFK